MRQHTWHLYWYSRSVPSGSDGGYASRAAVPPRDRLRLGQWVTPDEIFGRKLLFDGVNLSVAIILFEGSLGLKLREVRDLGRPIFFQLCTVTAGLAWVLITGAAMALGFDGRVSLLLGAILIVTGPTVINPILRQLRPTRRVSALLRWEGIVVDPLGAILALLVYQAITSIDGSSIGQGVLNLGLTLLVGLLFAGPSVDRHRDDETAPHPGLPTRRDFCRGRRWDVCWR